MSLGTKITKAPGRADGGVLASEWKRWGQLVLGIVCLVMIANLQYGWTLFIDPIDQKYHLCVPRTSSGVLRSNSATLMMKTAENRS